MALPTHELVLVYDLRRDESYRQRVLSGLDDQWQAYTRGEWPVTVAEGRITRLFYASYEGESMFELDEGARRTTWMRQGDNSWFAVGRRARVEHVVFRAPPP